MLTAGVAVREQCDIFFHYCCHTDIILCYDLGGSGQRKLSIVPMDTEGYSVRQLRTASNNGKNVLFLVPLQEELDTEPLPYNAAEFARMPQVPCLTCNTTMPLQMLALHAENCQPTTEVSCVICDWMSC